LLRGLPLVQVRWLFLSIFPDMLSGNGNIAALFGPLSIAMVLAVRGDYRFAALDPPLLFLDGPSAGLDPITSRRLDDLVLRLIDCLGTTFVVVTHELPQIYAIADNSIYLDAESSAMIAQGNPQELATDVRTDPRVRERAQCGTGGVRKGCGNDGS
jgi:ABC-type enterochelin transport system ATPase subunit